MKRKTHAQAILALMTLTVLFSGCLGSSQKEETTSAGPGVVITDFRSTFTEIYPEETTTVMLDFENRGDDVAKGVEGELVRKGAFGDDSDYDGPTELDLPIEDTYYGDEFIWDLTAPKITQTRTEEVQARLYYNYTTEGYATINFVPKEILREQGIGAFPSESSSTNAPVSIEIVPRQPKRLESDDAGKAQEVGITVVLENAWDGRVETTNEDQDGCHGDSDCVEELKIDIFCGNVEFKDSSDTWKTSGEYDTTSGVRVMGGQSGREYYDVEFNVSDVNAATSCQVKAITSYRYRIDSNVIPITIMKE